MNSRKSAPLDGLAISYEEQQLDSYQADSKPEATIDEFGWATVRPRALLHAQRRG